MVRVRSVEILRVLFFDVITRLGKVVSFETVAAETKEVEGIHVRVATPEALYRLKKE